MSETDYLSTNSQVTPEELETILMLTRKMEGGDINNTEDNRASSPEHETNEGVTNKRKRGRPQRALSSSAAVPLTTSTISSIQRSDMDLRSKDEYFDDRGSSSEQESHAHNNNIMSIQSMLNNSSNIPRQEAPRDDEEYADKNWRPLERKRKEREDINKGSYASSEYNNAYADQSWQETLDKAVKGRQEKDMLDELASILELPTKNFPHNTARLLYAKLEALKLLRETCNRGLITEELYSEKQQEFLDSMQF